ncbi:MAG: YicC family protein [Candidatus Eisenbacteria bacterium]|uniref:YicC family protein n=1 Tax=Eiseniibacteriota bacterium TaxID=2212470 RepID=A0A948RY03_UNCEI|nr:YicC family protein [Candidatus Eisenbacteria bacterium]MBU1948318.1 YicC family protein [Candidatus Eisenbacteria bacterium]MBU2693110.1 YicC family protein [Candidatus Eisenbacteria bacterium]
MIRSMTGYGRVDKDEAGQRTSVEIRSLNHRYCEVSARVPKSIAHMENRIREIITEQLERGKIHVSITMNGQEEGLSDIQINEANARRYLELAESLRAHLGVKGSLDMTALFTMPDVLIREPVEIDEEGLWSQIKPMIQKAMDDVNSMRIKEGEALARDLTARTLALEEKLEKVEVRLPKWLAEGKQRLAEKIDSMSQERDFNRFRLEAEIVLFVDRFDCTEECVRLRSHIRQIRHWIADPAPAGRKLNFLLQEVNREINTIGSKAQDVEIAREVVFLKEEVEKIREQVQNIE